MNKNCKCDSEPFKTQLAYGNLHTVRKHEIKSSLLGTIEQFCQAFWHIRETPEGGFAATCLNNNKCSTKPAIVLLVYGDYIARYSNCADRYHAEDFIYQDLQLLNLLNSTIKQKLLLYITLQPCHYSSKDMKKSCTVNLIEFAKQHNVEMEIVITYPYRTHWKILSQEDHAKYDVAIKNAGAGLKLLVQHFKVRAMSFKDWKYLMKFADKFEINNEKLNQRNAMDLYCASIIQQFSQ